MLQIPALMQIAVKCHMHHSQLAFEGRRANRVLSLEGSAQDRPPERLQPELSVV